jgi:hypothetical protein
VTTQKRLVKIPSGISVTRQETCYSSIVGCFRYSRWHVFQTLLKATYYAAVTGFMCCQIFQMVFFPDSAEESGKNTIWNICSNNETCYSSIESRKKTIWNICDNTEETSKNPIWKDSSKSNLLCCCNRFHVLSDIPDGIFSRLF